MTRTKCGFLALLLCAAIGSSVLVSSASAKPVAGTSISHGQFAAPDWGFTAAVYENGRFICSGSVVSPTAVLTAAHCLASPSRLTVRTGSSVIWGGGQYIGVSAVVARLDSGIVDVGILRLASPTTAPPITLATPEEDAAYLHPGSVMSIAGYGARQPNNWQKPKFGALRATNIRLGTRCKYLTRRFYGASEVCAVGIKRFRLLTTANACPGDSGGPMAVYLPEGLRLFGVLSAGVNRKHLGYRCGDIGGASIYERVAFSYAFIQANIGP